jgi:MFS-type transporter involved in bile tolerance (Atg22 family)
VSPSLVGMLKAETGSVYAGFAVIAALLIVGMVALLWAVPAPHRDAVGAVRPAALK